MRRHPWETARAAFFLRVLLDSRALRPGARALDVGAGDAWFATQLVGAVPSATVVCWDVGYDTTTVQLPSIPGLSFVSALPASSFGLALLLDVLEHVEDDEAFLSSVVEHLSPGAAALVSVPAWPRLFGAHDRALHHHRRYAPAAARALIERAGLRVERAGGLFHSLLLPRLVALTRERAGTPSITPAIEWRRGPVLTGLADTLLAADTSVSRLASSVGLDLPGLSWWALCRKPS